MPKLCWYKTHIMIMSLLFRTRKNAKLWSTIFTIKFSTTEHFPLFLTTSSHAQPFLLSKMNICVIGMTKTSLRKIVFGILYPFVVCLVWSWKWVTIVMCHQDIQISHVYHFRNWFWWVYRNIIYFSGIMFQELEKLWYN